MERYLGQCMVGRVAYLCRVKQGNYHTHVLHTIPNPNYTFPQTLSFHNNLPNPPPYFGYPDRESVSLCKYQHYPTLDTYLSLSFSDKKRIAAFLFFFFLFFFCLLLGPPGFNCWFSSAPVFQWCCSTPQGSPGVGRNTFLSSPHLCFIIVFICVSFVSRDDPLMS